MRCSADGAQQMLDPMLIGMLRHHVVVGLFNHAVPIIYISVSPDDFVDVAEILFNRDVVAVRFENAVVVSLQQNLAGLRPDGFEMTRGDALTGNLRCLPAVKAPENVFKARPAVLKKIVMP